MARFDKHAKTERKACHFRYVAGCLCPLRLLQGERRKKTASPMVPSMIFFRPVQQFSIMGSNGWGKVCLHHPASLTALTSKEDDDSNEDRPDCMSSSDQRKEYGCVHEIENLHLCTARARSMEWEACFSIWCWSFER